MIVFFLIFVCFQANAIHFFTGSYSAALEKAKIENKYILLYFTATWCGPCQYMNQYIFTNEEIDSYVNANYIVLKLDVDVSENKVLYRRYFDEEGVAIPRFVFINENEEVIKTQNGSATLSQFNKFIKIEEGGETDL